MCDQLVIILGLVFLVLHDLSEHIIDVIVSKEHRLLFHLLSVAFVQTLILCYLYHHSFELVDIYQSVVDIKSWPDLAKRGQKAVVEIFVKLRLLFFLFLFKILLFFFIFLSLFFELNKVLVGLFILLFKVHCLLNHLLIWFVLNDLLGSHAGSPVGDIWMKLRRLVEGRVKHDLALSGSRHVLSVYFVGRVEHHLVVGLGIFWHGLHVDFLSELGMAW